MNDVDDQLSRYTTDDAYEFGPAFANPWIVASVALVLGLVVDTLALHQPPGVGLAAGLVVGLCVAASISTLLSDARPRGTISLLIAGLVVAGFIAVRTSPVMIGLNVGAVAVMIAVLAQLHRHRNLTNWSITMYAWRPAATVADMAVGSSNFVTRDLRSGFGAAHGARLRSVAFGVLIGVPLLLVFGGLFASADDIFSNYVDVLVSEIFFGALFWRSVSAIVIGAAIAGLWRSMRTRGPGYSPAAVAPRLDRTTGVTVLGLLVALFVLFVLTQIVSTDPAPLLHREFSENARRGFFQLVTVAFLVLNVLLLFDWLTRRDGGDRSPAFDRLAMVLIGLTGLVMVSALGRMRLYVDEFGLTELRFYTTAFMFWLAFVLSWFIWTVLRDRHGLFALGLLASALVWIVALNAVNPDAFIVSTNWSRHESGATFSDRYNSELSLDSLPILIDIRQSQPPGTFCFIEQRISLSAEQLDRYRADHGILGDSWAASQARSRLAELELLDPATLACVDPRTLRVRTPTRSGD